MTKIVEIKSFKVGGDFFRSFKQVLKFETLRKDQIFVERKNILFFNKK